MRNRLLATGLVSVIALAASRNADAASLTIKDTLAAGIIFSVGQFDTGVGFVLDGVTILAPSLGTATATVADGLTHTFTGQFLTGGALFAPTSGTIAFVPFGGGISDILTFSYTGGGAGGTATLIGTFQSLLSPGNSLVAPPGATLVPESTTFAFNNINITAAVNSDVAPAVPEPASLALLGTGLLGLFRYRRKMR